MNAPDPTDHFLLSQDEKERWVTYKRDTKMANAGVFTILKEDHTIGNTVRFELLRDRRTIFAGYRMPHPLENLLVIKVRTREESNPLDVTLHAVENLRSELQTMADSFKGALAARQQQQQQGLHGMYDE